MQMKWTLAPVFAAEQKKLAVNLCVIGIVLSVEI